MSADRDEGQPIGIYECPDCIYTLEIWGQDEMLVAADHKAQHAQDLR